LFVALAEEGWTDGPIVEGVIHRYLDEIFVAVATVAHPDTLVLGCTHFPMLAPTLRKVLGPAVAIVDSAGTTADSLADVLTQHGVLRHDQAIGSVTLLATDDPERFARVGAVFLGRPLAPSDVEIVDLALLPASPGT
jgi:glutamate racemase